MKEYKIINLRSRFLSGTFDTNALEEELNMYAEHGWKVHSFAPDNTGGFGRSKYLIVLLEREKEDH